MSLYEIRENYYALWLASVKKIEPEKAFERLDAGGERSVKGRTGYYTEQSLIVEYLDLYDKLGRRPNMYEWTKFTGISMSPVKRIFGKWSFFEQACSSQLPSEAEK